MKIYLRLEEWVERHRRRISAFAVVFLALWFLGGVALGAWGLSRILATPLYATCSPEGFVRVSAPLYGESVLPYSHLSPKLNPEGVPLVSARVPFWGNVTVVRLRGEWRSTVGGECTLHDECGVQLWVSTPLDAAFGMESLFPKVFAENAR